MKAEALLDTWAWVKTLVSSIYHHRPVCHYPHYPGQHLLISITPNNDTTSRWISPHCLIHSQAGAQGRER